MQSLTINRGRMKTTLNVYVDKDIIIIKANRTINYYVPETVSVHLHSCIRNAKDVGCHTQVLMP